MPPHAECWTLPIRARRLVTMRINDRRTRSIPHRDPLLCFQQLEPRFALAGNVTVTVQDGLLRFSGDAVDNRLEAAFDSSSGQIRIRGIVASGSQTMLTVNGRQMAETMIAGVTSISASLGRGSDGLIITGDWARQVPLQLQSLSVNLGRGRDNSLQVLLTTTTNGLAADSGVGNDAFLLTNCSFAGATNIVTGDGADTFDARGCAFTSISYDAGAGNDSFVCEPYTNETTAGCFVERDVTIAMGDGNDGVRIDKTTILGTLSCSLGRNNDMFRMNRLTTARVYQVNGNADTDTLRLAAGVVTPAGFVGFEILAPLP